MWVSIGKHQQESHCHHDLAQTARLRTVLLPPYRRCNSESADTAEPASTVARQLLLLESRLGQLQQGNQSEGNGIEERLGLLLQVCGNTYKYDAVVVHSSYQS